jgi:MSHA biogenesis protein MshL
VSTLNNQKAVIKVGTDEFFVTDIATTTTSTSGATTTSPSVSLTPFFSGIALDVTPQVSDDGVITLHVHPTISEVSETNKLLPLGNGSQTVPLATANVRESDSVIRAKSGQVVVIGGLMQSVTDNQRAGIPGLSDVPVVGGAFGQRRNSELKKELVILLRPVVVENGDWTGVSQTLGMQDW